MGVLYQVLGTVITCYTCLSMGLIFAWPSSTLKIFMSENTTLDRPMGEAELALFGSLSSIGALISTPVAGYFLDVVGRKYCALVTVLTHVIAWAIIATCNQVEVILTGIFISGIGGAVFLVVPVYVGEICQESIRGAMTSGTMIFYGIGLLLSYLLGGLLEYRMMIYVSMTIAVVGVMMMGFMKESPTYLMMKGLEEEAAKSIAFYRNTKSDAKEVLIELDSLRRAFNQNLEEEVTMTPETEKLKLTEPMTQNTAEKLSILQFTKKSRSTRRAMFVTLSLMSLGIFQGIVVVQVYAEPLFEEAVPTISATLCSVLLAVISVFMGCVAAYLTDLAGRKVMLLGLLAFLVLSVTGSGAVSISNYYKSHCWANPTLLSVQPLMMYSSIAAGLFSVLLGTQLHLHWGPHWLTAVFIYLFCTACTTGAGTVPYVLVAEVFLPEVKSFMSMLVIEWGWLCNFIILFIFNPLVAILGLGPVFYIFAVMAFTSAVFCVVYQPETNGLPVDVIQMKFLEVRREHKYLD